MQRYINRVEEWTSPQAQTDARALWAFRVLVANGGSAALCGYTEDESRMVARAKAVFPGLPADVRAKLGECP